MYSLPVCVSIREVAAAAIKKKRKEKVRIMITESFVIIQLLHFYYLEIKGRKKALRLSADICVASERLAKHSGKLPLIK